MIEIVFSESAGGFLKCAGSFGRGEYRGEVRPAFIYYGDDGEKPSEKELETWTKVFHEKQKKAWEAAEPLDIQPKDVYDMDLGLSTGRIQKDEFSPQRLQWIRDMVPPGSGFDVDSWMKKKYQRYREMMDSAVERLKDGDSVRIWYSENPDEFCGLLWFCWRIRETGAPRDNVYTVKLPAWIYDETSDSVAEFRGWGEVDNQYWGRLAKHTERVPVRFVNRCAGLWEELRQENGMLRAVVNGRVSTVPEDFYDYLLEKELDALCCKLREAGKPEEFGEGRLIGEVIGRSQLGIWDSWLAVRVEKMIERGWLEVVREAEDGRVYGKILRRIQEVLK